MGRALPSQDSRHIKIAGYRHILFQCIPLGLASLMALQSGCSSKPTSTALTGQVMAAHSKTTLLKPKEEEHEAKMLTQVLKQKPNHVPVLLRLASLASASGKPAEAEKYLKEALVHEPGNVEARLELGKLLFEIGKIQDALQTTEGILKVQPDQPDALYNLGAIYGNLGNKQRAIEYWSRLLEVNPQSESGKRAQQMMGELQKTSP